jgi:hypothetical protein
MDTQVDNGVAGFCAAEKLDGYLTARRSAAST